MANLNDDCFSISCLHQDDILLINSPIIDQSRDERGLCISKSYQAYDLFSIPNLATRYRNEASDPTGCCCCLHFQVAKSFFTISFFDNHLKSFCKNRRASHPSRCNLQKDDINRLTVKIKTKFLVNHNQETYDYF